MIISTQNKGFNKGHIEVYGASVDELLEFHQLKRNVNLTMAEEVYADAMRISSTGFNLFHIWCFLLGRAIGAAIVETYCGLLRGGSWPTPTKWRRRHPVLLTLLRFHARLH
jgi:hypothetical protein